jgi:hypothetical protein
MRELTNIEVEAVSGGEIKEVGACRTDSAEQVLKTYAVALVNYLRDLWK